MIADMREALEAVLGPISEPVLLPGGASKEAWAVDAGGEPLLVRRAGGGVIHRHTLSLRHEFEVLSAAYEAGVKVPRPVAYIEDLDGREAFVMERLEGRDLRAAPYRRNPGNAGDPDGERWQSVTQRHRHAPILCSTGIGPPDANRGRKECHQTDQDSRTNLHAPTRLRQYHHAERSDEVQH